MAQYSVHSDRKLKRVGYVVESLLLVYFMQKWACMDTRVHGSGERGMVFVGVN